MHNLYQLGTNQSTWLSLRPLADCHYPTIELRLRPGSHRSRYALLRVKINQPDAASRVCSVYAIRPGGWSCGLKDHRIPRYHPVLLTMSERRFPQMSLCACAYNTSETHESYSIMPNDRTLAVAAANSPLGCSHGPPGYILGWFSDMARTDLVETIIPNRRRRFSMDQSSTIRHGKRD